MNHQTLNFARNRDRLNWVIQNPPRLSAADVRAILATCEPGPQLGEVRIERNDRQPAGDGNADHSPDPDGRASRVERCVQAALSAYVVSTALKAELPQADVKKRLKVIQEAVDHLERALGIRSANDQASFPWPIARRVLHVMMQQSKARVAPGTDIAGSNQAYLAELRRRHDELDGAMAGVSNLSRWVRSAWRLESTQLRRRKRSENQAYDSLIRSLAHVWVNELGQDLDVLNGYQRNFGRWTPAPESFDRFLNFVEASVGPLGVRFARSQLAKDCRRILKRRSA